jgi:peptidoglycan-associated lipoprotein
MKLVSKKLSLIIASAALVLAGCSKKPERPNPSSTLGLAPGGDNIAPPPRDLVTDQNSLLAPRDEFDPLTGQNRTALAGNTVYFDFDQSAIKASEREKLKTAKDYLDKNAGQRLLLEGHADWRGTAEYNLGLGDRRANAVKKYLLSIGLPADRVETVSKGSLEAKPNADASTMEKDRRVDLVVLKGK